MKLAIKTETATGFSDAYAVDFIGCGLVHESILQNARGYLLGHAFEGQRIILLFGPHPCTHLVTRRWKKWQMYVNSESAHCFSPHGDWTAKKSSCFEAFDFC